MGVSFFGMQEPRPTHIREKVCAPLQHVYNIAAMKPSIAVLIDTGEMLQGAESLYLTDLACHYSLHKTWKIGGIFDIARTRANHTV